MNMNDLANMSPEELVKLQNMVKEAQEKQKLGSKYSIYKAIDKLKDENKLPTIYYEFMDRIKDMDPTKIIPSILESDKLLRFPTLMVLANYLPCSDIEIRCGLVELFDSYVYHSDFGITIANLIPFDVDRTLRCCRSHDPNVGYTALEEFYRKVLRVLNSPSLEGGPREWVKKCMGNIVYMIHVVTGINIENRFAMSLLFLLPDITAYELNDPISYRELLDRLQGDGSDLIYAKRIAQAFRLTPKQLQ